MVPPHSHTAVQQAKMPLRDCYRGREHYKNCLPYNFSWLEGGRIAGCARPQFECELRALVEEGVSQLVSLSEETPPPAARVEGLAIHFIGVRDFMAPSLQQIQKFIGICKDANGRGERVAVHCRGGNGRTGTLLACYLVWSRGLGAGEAIARVRRSRPGSLESQEQERAVDSFQTALDGGGKAT